MGAPKQKWTSEEEAALKAGIQKYGTGKWSTILKDPKFSTILQSRSNVDLKDKWRNLNCMVHGVGSRHRARVSIKINQPSAKQDEDTTDATPLATASSDISQDTGSKKQISRLDNHILESITKLKEPRGSSRHAIAQYIEEHYSTPPDLDMTLAANLKTLTENGLLVKVKHQYRIAPRSISFTAGKDSPSSLANAANKDPSEVDRTRVIIPLTKANIDAELDKMKSMSAKEAAAAAAQAVAEAEAAIAEAEVAAQEAEEAEAEAEAAKCFADAARKALDCQTISV